MLTPKNCKVAIDKNTAILTFDFGEIKIAKELIDIIKNQFVYEKSLQHFDTINADPTHDSLAFPFFKVDIFNKDEISEYVRDANDFIEAAHIAKEKGVTLFFNNECSSRYWWSICPNDTICSEYWLASYFNKEDAEKFCEIHGLKVL